VTKAPARNPFGTEEEPKKFAEFDVFLKLRVLHQLSVWTMFNPDRLRERMVGHTEGDQTEWVCELVFLARIGTDRDHSVLKSLGMIDRNVCTLCLMTIDSTAGPTHLYLLQSRQNLRPTLSRRELRPVLANDVGSRWLRAQMSKRERRRRMETNKRRKIPLVG
jgi:hypothetical protein